MSDMVRSTWETCDKVGSKRCRARIAKDKDLRDRLALLEDVLQNYLAADRSANGFGYGCYDNTTIDEIEERLFAERKQR